LPPARAPLGGALIPAGNAPLASGGGPSSVKLPAITHVSCYTRRNPTWEVMADVQFTDWSTIETRACGRAGPGRAVPATGLLPPGHWAYSADVEAFDHDPAEARALLDQAGFLDPPGPAPRFRLVFKVWADSFRVSTARSIVRDLGAVGIEVEIRTFEFATYFADIKKGLYELAMMQTAEIVEPDMYFHHFHSSRIPSPEFPNAGNRWRYHSAEADALIEEGRRTAARDARRAIYGRLQRLVSHDMPIVPLWHEDNVAIVNREVFGYQVLPNARLAALPLVTKPR
jgi:peptide/nickel transport system substrate-binding protein